MLKRVLLAYARWNKSIGYCQGFNMLAAIILEVMEKSEPDALKVNSRTSKEEKFRRILLVSTKILLIKNKHFSLFFK